MSIRAVIFDRDNTLVYFDNTAIQVLIERTIAIAPQLNGNVLLETWQTWPGPRPIHPADEPSFWRSYWASIAETHQLTPEAAVALRTIGSFYHTCFVAYADSEPCVRALHDAGLRMGVLTNFELPSVERTLEYVGLDPKFFSAAISSASIGAQKPQPAAFRAILAALREEPEACLFIDDTPGHVVAARQLGMSALLIDRTRTSDDLSAGIICSLASLPELLLSPFAGDALAQIPTAIGNDAL